VVTPKAEGGYAVTVGTIRVPNGPTIGRFERIKVYPNRFDVGIAEGGQEITVL
jgi:hypothetical protein